MGGKTGKIRLKLAMIFGLFVSSCGFSALALGAQTDAFLDHYENEAGKIGALNLDGLAYEIEAAEGFYGQEALLLQARLKADGGLITRAIHWRVQRLTEIGGFEPMQTGDTAAFAMPAKPGTYRVDIYYGLASLTQIVQLPEGEQRTLTFILDVGGLRMNATFESEPLPPNSTIIYRIYGRSGPNRGRLITQTAITGELIRLPAGQYWIENVISGDIENLGQAEAAVGTSITIKPGILSNIEIDHKVRDKTKAADHVDRRRQESAYLPKIMR